MQSPVKVYVAGTRGFPGIQGGVETHCEHLYPRLSRLGCDVTVFRRTPYLKKPRRRSYEGVKFIDLWCPRLRSLEAFAHTLTAVLIAALRRADILHIHCVGPALCTPIAKRLGLKVVFTSQGPDYEREKWGPLAKMMLRLGERLGSEHADRTIVVSDHIRDLLKDKHGVESDLIPNGVTIPEPSASTEYLEKWGLRRGQYVFAAGRFVPEKRFHDLVQAFCRLQTEWKLAIAGQADHPSAYSRALEARATEAEGVVLTGFVGGEELRQLYTHCGLFVLPSRHEGLPLALLEALSYGNSVLASDIPAHKEVPLRADRFFRVGDVGHLSERMAYWMQRGITDEEKRENLRLLHERYNWDTIARRTLDVYRKVSRSGL